MKKVGAPPVSDSFILAIDLGTSSLKLALVSLRGEVAGFRRRVRPRTSPLSARRESRNEKGNCEALSDDA